MSDNNSIIRFGLIGAGKWGINFIKTINKNDKFSLVAVSSRNPSTKNFLKSESIIYEKWQDMLSNLYFDGVIIASPPNTHFEIILECLKRKIPILVEKPITTTLQDAEILLSIIKKDNFSPIILVDHVFLYHPHFIEMKRKIDEYGVINKIKSIGGNYGPFRKDISALWDWGPHDLSICLDLMKEMPIKVYAKTIKKQKIFNQKAELIEAKLLFSNNSVAEIIFGNLMDEKKRTVNLDFKDHILTFSPFNEEILGDFCISKNKKIPIESDHIKNKNLTPLENILEKFAKAIISNKEDIADLKLAVNVVNIIEQIDCILNSEV